MHILPDDIGVRFCDAGVFHFSELRSAKMPATVSAKSIPCALPVYIYTISCRCITYARRNNDPIDEVNFGKCKLLIIKGKVTSEYK